MPEITMNMPELPTYKGRQMEWTGERRIPADGEYYASIYYDGGITISCAWHHNREEWIVRRKRWMPKQGEECWYITADLMVDKLIACVPSNGHDINIWNSREATENALDAVVKLLESLDPETGMPWPPDPSEESYEGQESKENG
jgi:hypothetical protein